MDRIKKFYMWFCLMCMSALAFAVVAYASEGGSATVDVSSLVGTAATNAVSQANSTLSTLIPIVMGLIGTVVAVKLGIRLFKSFTNKAG